MSWLLFFVAGPALGMTASIVLFGGALATLRGRNRQLLWGPGTVLALLVVWTFLSLVGQSNLWPLPMMAVGPPCALLVAVIWSMGLIQERGRSGWAWCVVPLAIIGCAVAGFAARPGAAAVPLALLLMPFSFLLVAALALVGLLLPRVLARMRRSRGVI